MADETQERALVLAKRHALVDEIRRNQRSAYDSTWVIGAGVLIAIPGFLFGGMAIIGGVGGVALVGTGITRGLRALKRVARAHDQLRELDPAPLPTARVVR